MKKYTVLSVLTLTCLSMQAAELDGVRFAGYTTNVVKSGFSIVAVPFSGYNTNTFETTNLSLAELISTNGLSIGNRLIAFHEASTNYYWYEMTATNWIPLQVTDLGSDPTNRVINAPALSTIMKAHGYAFWLKTASEKTVYLQGVVNTNESLVEIAAGPSFTLVGNALPTELNLNSEAFTNNAWFYPGFPGKGDEIHVVSMNGTYNKNVYYGGGWKKIEYTTSNTLYNAASDPIPAGSGMWYLRRGTTAETLVIK